MANYFEYKAIKMIKNADVDMFLNKLLEFPLNKYEWNK